MEKPRCPTCYWFEPGEGSHERGFCFYDKPVATLAQMQSMMGGPAQPQAISFNPPVGPTHFCRHHSDLADDTPMSRLIEGKRADS